MCGFAFLRHGGNIPDDLSFRVSKTKSCLVSRGPDGHGIDSTSDAVMLHYRLSIVGGGTGKQPLWSSDKSCVVLFNGEIYNYRKLMVELSSLGVVLPAGCSDTEVLLHAYLTWGEGVFSKLDGMFACVFYHPKTDRVIAGVDRHGIKPLFISGSGDNLVIGSTLSSNQSLSGLPNKQPSRLAIDQFLRVGFNFGGETFHPDIRQLKPGTYTEFVAGEVNRQLVYWSPDVAMMAPYTKTSKKAGAELLKQAFSEQWCPEQSSGIFLSSGIDSEIIRHFYQAEKPLNFTASFSGEEFDEWSALNSAGITSGRVLCDEKNLLNTSLLLKLYDAPFADNAALPTYWLSKSAQKSVKVVYSGDGADELFLGYRNHRLLLLESKLKGNLPGALRASLTRFSRTKVSSVLRMSSTLKTFERSWGDSYIDALSQLPRSELNDLFLDKNKGHINADHASNDIEKSLQVDCPIKRIQAMDWSIYLPGSVLTKVDRATMSNGIEARVPYLSNCLVDHFIQAPYQANLNLRQGKHALRSFAQYAGVNNKGPKRAFINPMHRWLSQQDLRFFKKNILHESLLDQGWFSARSVEGLVSRFLSGEHHLANTLWSLMLLKTYCCEKGF